MDKNSIKKKKINLKTYSCQMDKKIINIKTTNKQLPGVWNFDFRVRNGILQTLGLLLSRYRLRLLITGNVGRFVVVTNISEYTWYKHGIHLKNRTVINDKIMIKILIILIKICLLCLFFFLFLISYFILFGSKFHFYLLCRKPTDNILTNV